MLVRLRERWQKIKQHPYATGFAVLLVLVLILFIFLAYRFGWDWTGFSSGTNQITIKSTSNGNYTATISQPLKSLWDWLNLLGVLAIPAVVGLGAAWYTAQQGKVSERENKDNQREKALQDYIDKMSELLLNQHLGELLPDGKAAQKYRQQQNGNIKDELKPEYEAVLKIARVRTLTVLPRLDAKRKRSVLLFLHESGLINRYKTIVYLWGADLSGADLSHTNLLEANLTGTNLRAVDLSGTKMRSVILYKADLSGAKINSSQLEQVADLAGATMPDGSRHP
jgi:hypothetical protein